MLILKKLGHGTKQISVCLFVTQLLRKETALRIHKTQNVIREQFLTLTVQDSQAMDTTNMKAWHTQVYPQT
jgi:hypothetical protein